MSGIWLKSDQNGIEITLTGTIPVNAKMLKSDQNGIEITVEDDVATMKMELKSDQNGIEMPRRWWRITPRPSC